MNDALNPYGNMICILIAGMVPGLGNIPIIFPSVQHSPLGSPQAPSLTPYNQDIIRVSSCPSA